MFRPRYLALALLAGALASATARADFAELILTSPRGDFVGGGKDSDVVYTPDNTVVTFFRHQISNSIGGQPSFLSFSFLLKDPATGLPAAQDEEAGLDFSTQQLGVPLAVGTYTDAQRAAFATAGHPGLDVSFERRGSNTLTGQFTINSLSFFRDLSNQLQIGNIDVSFQQLAQGSTATLSGHFIFQSSAVPEPASLSLLGLGLAGLAARARRRAAR